MSDGWHDDPLGRYAKRYYDGSQWTNHVTDGSGATIQDPLGTQATPGGAPPSAPSVSPSEMSAASGFPGFGAIPGNPWARFAARIIDALIIGIPLYFILDGVFDIGTVETVNTDSETSFDAQFDYPTGAVLIQLAVWSAYEIIMHGKFGRTIGKMALGLTVVRRNDRSIPGYGVAAVRYVVGLIYAIPLIGWLIFIVTVIMGFSGELRQTIHDKAASTVVAKTSSL